MQKRIRTANEKENQKYARFLASGEKIVSTFGIGRRYFLINLVLLVPLSFLLVGLFWLFKLMHLHHSLTYILTDRRVIIKDGVFSIKLTSAPYDKITYLTVREDFAKRICYGVGDITIHTAGPTPVEIHLIRVEDPMQVKNLIEELIVRERSLLGSVVEKDPFIHPLI